MIPPSHASCNSPAEIQWAFIQSGNDPLFPILRKKLHLTQPLLLGKTTLTHTVVALQEEEIAV